MNEKKTRKPLTDEQRAAKNARDRERRAAKRAEQQAAKDARAESEKAYRRGRQIGKSRTNAEAIEPESDRAERQKAELAETIRKHTHPTREEIRERQAYRDARISILVKRPEGETWAQRKARHRELDAVMREGGRIHPEPRRKPASGCGRQGLVTRAPQ